MAIRRRSNLHDLRVTFWFNFFAFLWGGLAELLLDALLDGLLEELLELLLELDAVDTVKEQLELLELETRRLRAVDPLRPVVWAVSLAQSLRSFSLSGSETTCLRER